jgi:hypothetical protein
MKKQKAGPLLAVSLCLLLLGGGIIAALAMSSDNYSVGWSVLSSGGGPAGSDNYKARSSITQTGIGPSSSNNYLSGSGYWYRGIKPAPGPAIPPNIISFAPPSPVNDTVCNWTTFNVTVNQTVNVSWYLNESLLFTNESVTNANCTVHAEVAGEHNVSAIASNANGTDMQMWIWTVVSAGVFDTGPGTYPSISGTHNGTITPNQTITVSKLYTYPCSGTGGHSEHVRIWNDTWAGIEASWTGYRGGWHSISFSESFTLVANETYSYTICTGSYPQIIHESPSNATGGTITCDKFIDANGRIYYDWIPAIRLK